MNTITTPSVIVDSDLSNFAFVPPWVIADPALTNTAFRVLSVLLTFRGYTEIYPSRKTIASLCGMTNESSYKTITGVLNLLKELGYVSVYERFDSDGGRTSNGYRINLKFDRHKHRLPESFCPDTPSHKNPVGEGAESGYPSRQNPAQSITSLKEKEEREIFEFPSDLSGLKFYEQQIGESIEPFVDQLRDEIKRLGELRVIAKAKDCTNGESWQYLLKSLRKLNENEPEPEKKPGKVVQVEQWQPSEYAHKDDPAEEQRESFASEQFNDDASGETPTIQLPANVSADDQYYFDMGLQQLELQFDRSTFDTWIKSAKLTSICHESNTMTFEVPNQYAQHMLQTRLYRNLRRVFSDTWNKNMELVFTLGSRDSHRVLPTQVQLKTGHVSACPA